MILSRSEMLTGQAELSYCTEAKRINFVSDSTIKWKPVRSAKKRCNVVCARSFQDETNRIVPKPV